MRSARVRKRPTVIPTTAPVGNREAGEFVAKAYLRVKSSVLMILGVGPATVLEDWVGAISGSGGEEKQGV